MGKFRRFRKSVKKVFRCRLPADSDDESDEGDAGEVNENMSEDLSESYTYLPDTSARTRSKLRSNNGTDDIEPSLNVRFIDSEGFIIPQVPGRRALPYRSTGGQREPPLLVRECLIEQESRKRKVSLDISKQRKKQQKGAKDNRRSNKRNAITKPECSSFIKYFKRQPSENLTPCGSQLEIYPFVNNTTDPTTFQLRTGNTSLACDQPLSKQSTVTQNTRIKVTSTVRSGTVEQIIELHNYDTPETPENSEQLEAKCEHLKKDNGSSINR